MADRLMMVGHCLNWTFYCTLLVFPAVERAHTRFSGLVSVLESPAEADPRWLARTKNDLGVGVTLISTMAGWMANRDIRQRGATVDAGRACPLHGSLVELASDASRLRMHRTCHETDVAWASQVTTLDGATVNLAGVAGVSARRVLQLVLGARTGGQLGEAWRM